ncbi:hypothetical protein [Catenulispora subtropica]|uniref:hypothetical protein n=1 Tax=Catenulispora subtropica TaxID=450798 RepID=UPI0031E3CF12
MLLRCVAAMRRLAPAWDRPDVARYLIHHVEAAAQAAERRTPWTSRAPLGDAGVRTALREPGEAVAQLLRAHKRPLALARSRAEFDKVADSLTAGLLAMATEDWKALFANAPEPRKRWMSSYAVTRALPAAVLGIAALVLPWVPPFRHSALPTASIRVSLATFAILRLVPGPSVADLIDKGLSRGFDASKRG